LAVIGVREVKEDGNVIADVHRLNHDKRGGVQRVEEVRDVGVRGGR
jgi:hypothetical protein